MERIHVHRRDRTRYSSDNFFKQGESIITLSHLFSRHLGMSLKDKLEKLSSNKKCIEYLAEETANFTRVKLFPQ